jgi:beta-glucosidase
LWDTKKTRELNVSVTVKNAGNRSGIETVLLYSSDLYATISPDVKRLRKFVSVDLEAGAASVVNFTLTPDDLSFVNLQNKRVLEPGAFTISVKDLVVPFKIV